MLGMSNASSCDEDFYVAERSEDEIPGAIASKIAHPSSLIKAKSVSHPHSAILSSNNGNSIPNSGRNYNKQK